MRYNSRFKMRDLFMNKELEGVFPQFSRNEVNGNNLSDSFIRKKILNYLASALNGKIVNNNIVVNGKFKDKFAEITSLKLIIEDMFNNYSNLSVGLVRNLKLYTPFQSITQLKNIKDNKQRIEAMQTVLENIKYNPNFQQLGASFDRSGLFIKEQKKWLNKVSFYNQRR